MTSELHYIHGILSSAKEPEDIFGEIIGTREEKERMIKKIYRDIVKKTHPDTCAKNEQIIAAEAFQLISKWWQDAKAKIQIGNYGFVVKTEKIRTIKSRNQSYQIIGEAFENDLCTVYRLQYSAPDGKLQNAIAKIANEESDNDLFRVESRVIKELRVSAKSVNKIFFRYVPRFIEGFAVNDGKTERAVNVLKDYPGYYSLADVRNVYPLGVDSKTFAWIWNRLLEIMGFVHKQMWIHGSIHPENVLIHPECHGIKLVNWTAASSLEGDRGMPLRYMSEEYSEMYPEEVLKKKDVSPATDIYMAAKTMIYILGLKTGDELGKKVTNKVGQILKACLFSSKNKRMDNAWQVRDIMEKINSEVFGGKAYHMFVMPKHEK